MIQNVFTVDEVKKKLEYYCSYQDRCHQEVEKKLSSFQLVPEAKEHILIYLVQHNFLNEQRFAQSFARGKFRIKKWSKRKIIKELEFRNIAEHNIKFALEEINEEEYQSTLYRLASKKMETIKEENLYIKKYRVFQYLTSMGFESQEIQEIWETIKE